MPSTTDAKLFAVAKALAEGMPVEKALLSASYAAGTAKGKQLRWVGPQGERMRGTPSEHPVVAKYMAKLRTKASNGAAVTIATLSTKLDNVYEGAQEDREWSAATSAVMGQAKLHGLLVTKTQEVKPIDEMNEAELEQLMGEEETRAR